MMEPNSKHYLALKGLIDECVNEIRACTEWHRLKIRVYYELSKLGAHLRAEKEGLFDEELWATKENKDKILELIEAFLWRSIR